MAAPDTILPTTEELPPNEDMAPAYQRVQERHVKDDLLAQLMAPAPEEREAPPPPPPKPKPEEDDGISGLKVASEVAGGIRELPEAIFNGIVETAADVALTLNDLDQYVASKFKGTRLEQPSTFAEISREAAAELLPPLLENEETSFLGNMAHDVANFATGMIPVSRALSGSKFFTGLAKRAPEAARITGAAISGALADFVTIDTADADLSELLEDYPALRIPVTEFLAGDPDDPAVDARFKSSLIGLPLGIAADGLFLGLKALRGWNRTRVQLKRAKAAEFGEDAIAEATALKGPRTTAEQVRISNFDPDDESLIRAKKFTAAQRLAKAEKRLSEEFPDLTPDQLADKAEEAAQATVRAGKSLVDINIDALNTTDDVTRLMQEATDMDWDAIDRARRGVVSNEATKRAADRLNLGMSDILTRRKGAAPTAAEVEGYKRVWIAVGESTEDAARAFQASGSDVDNLKWRRSLAVFDAVNQQFQGARAEAGRALQSFRITTSGDHERAQQISALLESTGRSRVSGKLAEKFLDAIDKGHSPGQINALANRGKLARTVDAVLESSVLGLLWRPSTHAANIASNSVRIMAGIAEKGVAARIGREMMTDGGVEVGEATAQLKGTIGAIRTLWTGGAEAEALRDSVSRAVSRGSKIDVPQNAITARKAGLSADSGLGRLIEAVGNVVTIPGRVLEQSDELFKSVLYAGEVQAQAWRQAGQEARLNGWDELQISRRIAELTSNPPEHIRMESGRVALEGTFQQQPGKAIQAVMQIRNYVPPLAFIIPFVKTPANVFRYTFEFSPLAPLVAGWNRDVLAGGSRQNIALARLAIGTSISALVADWAWEGHILPPLGSKQGIREAGLRQGLQATSLNIGGRSFNISRLDPFGLQVHFWSEMAAVLKAHDIEDEDFASISELSAAGISALSSYSFERSMLTGVSRLTRMMQNVEVYGPKFIEQTMQTLVPFSSALKGVNQLIEPRAAQVLDIGDSLMSMIPVFSQRLARSHDLYGEPLIRERADLINPFPIRRIEETPIDMEIRDNQVNIVRPGRRTSFRGVDVNMREFPRVKEQYDILIGKGVKDSDGLSLKPRWNKMVRSEVYQKEWSKGPDGRRALQIKRVYNFYKKKAQREILDEDGDFQDEQFVEFREYVQRKRREDFERLIAPPEN